GAARSLPEMPDLAAVDVPHAALLSGRIPARKDALAKILGRALRKANLKQINFENVHSKVYGVHRLGA
ncbi:hypothetical protein, partial [Desulfovibrio sp. 1214_IL3152]